MSVQETTIYTCDVCGKKLQVDTLQVIGLTVVYTFPRYPTPIKGTRHVCSQCYPTATLPQVTGIAAKDARFCV